MRTRRKFEFCLYVADDSANSAEAIGNLSAICAEYLPDRHAIEVVDVFKEPARAAAASVSMTPTLIRVSPSPMRRIVGTLGQTTAVLEAMGIETRDA